SRSGSLDGIGGVTGVPHRKLAARATHDLHVRLTSDCFPRLVLLVRRTAQQRTGRHHSDVAADAPPFLAGLNGRAAGILLTWRPFRLSTLHLKKTEAPAFAGLL